jgi:hypothetical protein
MCKLTSLHSPFSFLHWQSSRISKNRDSAWFQKTWLDYVRKEYRAALLKWNNTETGGGDGSSESFQNYCGSRRWVGWVYLLDEESGFLLASNSPVSVPEQKIRPKKRHSVPEHFRNESGARGKSTGEMGRMDISNDTVMKKLEIVEMAQDKQEKLNSQLLARDAFATKLPIVDESKALFEELREIVNDEKQITMDASMDADTTAIFLEALNHRREALKREVVAYNDGKKRKASEMSDKSS